MGNTVTTTLSEALYQRIVEEFRRLEVREVTIAAPGSYEQIAEKLGIKLAAVGSGWGVTDDGEIWASKTKFRNALGRLAADGKIAVWREEPKYLEDTKRPRFVRLKKLPKAS